MDTESKADEETVLATVHYNRLVDLYKKDKESQGTPCGEVRVQYTMEYNQALFQELMKSTNKTRAFRIVSIERTDNEELKFCFSIALSSKKKNVETDDLTGTFKVNFSDGTFMYFTKWLVGSGMNRMIDSIFAAEDGVWINFLSLINQDQKRRNKPPIGKVYRYENGAYLPIEKLKETPVVHESVGLVKEDIDMFFGNLDMFTRWNMPGVRKIMLVGPPGTGKSSFNVRIANQNMKTKNVTFFDDINALAGHMRMCAKYKIPTICILEDAETSLQRPDSGLLNFLDGVGSSVHTEGAYIIMTTNHPHKIEPRILKRAGRVDQIFGFGNLKGEYVMKCAEIYLKDSFFGKDKVVLGTKKQIENALNELFDADGKGIAGTRIKQFSEDVLKYIVSKKKDNISLDEVRSVFKNTENNMKTVYEMALEQGLLEGDIGFGWDEPQKNESTYDESNFA